MRPQFTFLTFGAALLTAGLSTAATPAVAASSGTFSPTGSMVFATAGANATLLPDGRVLVTGGGSQELYDPASGTWAVTGQMNTPRGGATATLLPDGQVLVAGGCLGHTSSTIERSRCWSRVAPPSPLSLYPVLSCTTRRPARGR